MAHMENRVSSRLDILQAQLDVVKAQNVRLSEENALLRHKLERLTSDQRSNSAINVEAKIKALQLEDERDNIYEQMERLKKKYNKLHEAYVEKVKRCKVLEETFERQKTLTGLVMKSSLEQRHKDISLQKSSSPSRDNLEAKVIKLQTALDEAYDIIDELDFELESIDYLELENQRLQKELHAFKTRNPLPPPPGGSVRSAPSNGAEDEAPPHYYEATNYRDTVDGHEHHSRDACSSICESCIRVDDVDAHTLEQAALTESLRKNAEAESNCLRRELIRCRLQNTKKKCNI